MVSRDNICNMYCFVLIYCLLLVEDTPIYHIQSIPESRSVLFL